MNDDYTCVACGEEATEGFCLGRLCYHCISETVVDHIKQKRKEEGADKDEQR